MQRHGKFHRLLVAAGTVLAAAGAFGVVPGGTLLLSVPLLVWLICAEEISAAVEPQPKSGGWQPAYRGEPPTMPPPKREDSLGCVPSNAWRSR